MSALKKTTAISLLLGSAFLLSCGGSSSSTDLTPMSMNPPPPPPVSTVPTAVVTSDKTDPDEGQNFTLDARSSTDPDSKTLTYSIAQTSGVDAVAVESTGTPDGVFTFEVPELTASETLSFDVTVSNGTDSDTARINIFATNIELAPAFMTPEGDTFKTEFSRDEPLNAKFRFTSQYWYRDGNLSGVDTYIGPYPTNGDNITIKNNDNINQSDIPSDGNFKARVINLDGDHTNEHESLGIVLADLDKQEIGIYRSEAAPVFFKAQSIDTQNMCDIGFFKADFVDPDSFLASWSKHTSSADQHLDMLVGLDGGGIEVYRRRLKNPGSTLDDYLRHDEMPSFKLADVGHYCDLFGPFGTRVLFEGRFYTVSTEFMGFDRVAKNFSIWESSDSPNRIEPVDDETVDDRAKLVLGPIDVNIPANLEIIDVKMGSFRGDAIINFREYYPSQFYTVILVSDGKHDGDHRVISYFWERGTTPKEADRQEVKWDKGVPTTLSLVTSRDAPRSANGKRATPDIIVTAPDLPYLIVLENEKKMQDGEPYQFTGPVYIEAELGIERRINGRYVVPSEKKSLVITKE